MVLSAAFANGPVMLLGLNEPALAASCFPAVSLSAPMSVACSVSLPSRSAACVLSSPTSVFKSTFCVSRSAFRVLTVGELLLQLGVLGLESVRIGGPAASVPAGPGVRRTAVLRVVRSRPLRTGTVRNRPGRTGIVRNWTLRSGTVRSRAFPYRGTFRARLRAYTLGRRRSARSSRRGSMRSPVALRRATRLGTGEPGDRRLLLGRQRPLSRVIRNVVLDPPRPPLRAHHFLRGRGRRASLPESVRSRAEESSSRTCPESRGAAGRSFPRG